MTYFKYPCASEGCWKAVSVVMSVLLILLGAYNVAHGAIVRQVYFNAKDVNALNPSTLSITNDIFEAQLMPVGAVIIVAGSVVMAIYIVILFLICLQLDRVLWSKVINIINIIAFGLQFAVGVASCLQVIYFKQLYKPYLQKSFVDAVKAGADGPVKTLVLKLNDAVHMTQAEAVLAFVIGLLCPLILAITLHYQTQQTHSQQPYKNNQSAQRIA